MRDHNKAAGDLAFIVVQSDEDAQKLTDAAFSIEELQAEIESNLEKLSRAIAWIEAVPHSDNCFVSSNYDGDPGDRCNCGKDSIVEYLNESQPQPAERRYMACVCGATKTLVSTLPAGTNEIRCGLCPPRPGEEPPPLS